MKVELKKLESVHSNLRTDVVVGETLTLPEVGIPFVMYSTPLEATEGIRIITTTVVKETKHLSDGSIIFQTNNSTYVLKIVDDIKPEAL